MADTKTGGVLTLRICTPAGVTDTLECDSVSFAIPDGADGSGGGRIGIRPGHIAALIAVAPGRLEASPLRPPRGAARAQKKGMKKSAPCCILGVNQTP